MAKRLFLTPRWSKIWADLCDNKLRSVLAVLAISVGVFAVGMVYSSYLIFQKNLELTLDATSPASATLHTDLFYDELVESVHNIRGVFAADGRRIVSLRVLSTDGLWKELTLVAIPNYFNQKVNIIHSKSGVWPPGYGEVLLERSSMPEIGNRQDSITVETKDRRKVNLKVTGVAYDPSQIPTQFSGVLYGYISMNTLEKLDEERLLNQVSFIVQPWLSNEQGNESVTSIGRQAWNKLEQDGVEVHSLEFNKPRKHLMQEPINVLNMLLEVLGALALVSSILLLVSTVTGMLSQEVRQIAIMKAIGGSQTQIVRLYLVLVAVYGSLALIVAIPLAALAANQLTGFISKALNLESSGIILLPRVLALEVIVAIIVPVIATFWPIWQSVKRPVREAISHFGISDVESKSCFDKWIDDCLFLMKGLPRPLLFSLRNAFRRKGRLAITLMTLMIAGTMFMAVFTVRSSLYSTLDQYLDYFHYDNSLFLAQSYQTSRVEQAVLNVPGVKEVEPWIHVSGQMFKNGSKDTETTTSQDIVVYGLPPDSSMIRPKMFEGRWLVQGDESALVVTTDMVRDNSWIKVGGPAFIKVGKRMLHGTIVGITQSILGQPVVYVPNKWLNKELQQTGKTDWVQVSQVSKGEQNPKEQYDLGIRLQENMGKSGIHVQKVNVTRDLKNRVTSQFDVITTFLFMMSFFLAIIGFFGLVGIMGINVLERTRELGVMRAIGASNMEIGKIFVLETLCIGLMSWLLGVTLSFPLAAILSYQVGMVFLNHPLSFTMSLSGCGIWLLIVVCLSVLASLFPAWKASKLSVRDVISGE